VRNLHKTIITFDSNGGWRRTLLCSECRRLHGSDPCGCSSLIAARAEGTPISQHIGSGRRLPAREPLYESTTYPGLGLGTSVVRA